jgi:urea carboxylase
MNYQELEKTVRALEQDVRASARQVLNTRIIEIPVWYNDPYTNETGSRFREGYHQRPDGNDLDYAAEVNGLADAAEFIKRHHESPWLVSMVGFVAGLPFLYQLVDQKHQLQVPKYLSPRTDTPALTIGHGGCFSCIYSVRGAGGYQMFGVAAAPIYDPTQKLKDFKDFMVFFNPGDIVKFTPVDEPEYRRIQKEVDEGTFVYRQAPIQFDVGAALADPEGYNKTMMEALNGI